MDATPQIHQEAQIRSYGARKLTPGTHKLQVRARDAAFNYSAPIEAQIVVPRMVTLPGGAATKAAAGLELPGGSVVAVDKDGKAALLLESGAVDELDPGTRYTVGGKAEGTRRTNLGSGIALAMRELSEAVRTPIGAGDEVSVPAVMETLIRDRAVDVVRTRTSRGSVSVKVKNASR